MKFQLCLLVALFLAFNVAQAINFIDCNNAIQFTKKYETTIKRQGVTEENSRTKYPLYHHCKTKYWPALKKSQKANDANCEKATNDFFRCVSAKSQ